MFAIDDDINASTLRFGIANNECRRAFIIIVAECERVVCIRVKMALRQNAMVIRIPHIFLRLYKTKCVNIGSWLQRWSLGALVWFLEKKCWQRSLSLHSCTLCGIFTLPWKWFHFSDNKKLQSMGGREESTAHDYRAFYEFLGNNIPSQIMIICK